MMDRRTLAAYDSEAAAFAKDWHEQPAPADLQDVVMQYFIRGGTTVDIGCGSGRDVAWLNASGFPAVGFDASDGLLAEARSRYPALNFKRAELPDLKGIPAHAYDNVLCETVIMHLDRRQIAPSVRRMLDIVKPCGVLYLSWRVTDDADVRDAHGRLYTAFDAPRVLSELTAATVLTDEKVLSVSSGKKIHRILVKKTG
jgi:SAM-dependent methyltransferase